MSINFLKAVSTTTTNGLLNKAWYNIDGRICLVKGNSLTSHGGFGFEPYSECMCSAVLNYIGFPHVKYFLRNASEFPEIKVFGTVKHVSVCENFLKPDERLISLFAYLEFVSQGSKVVTTLNALRVLQESINLSPLYAMLAFDAVVGNEDRHLNNVSLIQSLDGSFRFSPIYDNGASLLAWKSFEECKRAGNRYILDKSEPFRSRHRTQIRLIPTKVFKHCDLGCFYINLLSRISSYIGYLPKYRQVAIKKYLKWRMEYVEQLMY